MTTVSPKPTSIQLFDAATTSSSSASYYTWGPRMAFQLNGIWDGATINIEVSLDDGSTWNVLTGHAYTADTAKVVWTTRSMKVRATIANSGASTSLSAWLLLSNDDRC